MTVARFVAGERPEAMAALAGRQSVPVAHEPFVAGFERPVAAGAPSPDGRTAAAEVSR